MSIPGSGAPICPKMQSEAGQKHFLLIYVWSSEGQIAENHLSHLGQKSAHICMVEAIVRLEAIAMSDCKLAPGSLPFHPKAVTIRRSVHRLARNEVVSRSCAGTLTEPW